MALIELAHDAIIVRDMSDRIVFWNRGAEQMFGWSKEEAVGRVIQTLLKTRYTCSREEIVRDLMATGSWAGELIHTARDGGDVFAENRQTLLKDAQGTAIRKLGINLDITGRKKDEEKIRDSEKQLKNLSAQLLLAQEQERKRIAHDLHDGLAADLAAIKFSLERKLLSGKDSSAGQMTAEEIISIIQRTIEDVRNIMNDLHPSILDDLGILPTLSWYCRQFHSIYADISIEPKIAVQEEEIPGLLHVVIFRVLQEALSNAAKHSYADRVNVSLTADDEAIHLAISDNGRGFDLEGNNSGDGQKGLGLGSMRERVELSGGEFRIVSRPGEGTTVRALWAKRPGSHFANET